MQDSQIYLLALLRSNPGNKLTQQDLNNKVTEDILQNTGPYIKYSKSYRMTRFNKDISELISQGFLRKKDDDLEMPVDAVRFLDKLPKSPKATRETIYAKLMEYLSNGHALKLEILRLLSGEARDIRAKLRNSMWSEKAIETAMIQLFSDNVIAPRVQTPKFRTAEIAKGVKNFLEGHREKVIDLALDKRDESERLQIILSRTKRAGQLSIDPLGVANLLLDLANELKSNKVEILSEDYGRLNKLRLVFNQELYEISNKDEELTDIPYFDTEKALFICDKVNPIFVKNFCSEFNAGNRKKCAIYDLRTFEKFDVTDDRLFRFVEVFLRSKFNITFSLPSRVFDKTQEIIAELTQALEKEKEESARKKVIDEGFLFTQINIPWALGTKIEELFKKAKSIIRISNPYIDDSTFHLLQATASVKILLLTTLDRQLDTKVSKNKLTKREVQKTLGKKRIEIKRIPNLHARFITVDDEFSLFLSTDLQTASLTSKYQYGSWTNNSEVVRSCISYFDAMWGDAEPCDLIQEIEALEKKKRKVEGS